MLLLEILFDYRSRRSVVGAGVAECKNWRQMQLSKISDCKMSCIAL